MLIVLTCSRPASIFPEIRDEIRAIFPEEFPETEGKPQYAYEVGVI